MRLRADRVDLPPQQRERRLVRGHADGHLGRPRRQRARVLGRLDPPELRVRVGRAACEPGAQADDPWRGPSPRGQPRHPPEPAAVGGLRLGGVQRIDPRHAVRHQRLLLPVDDERERRDRRVGGEARPAHEHGGAAADPQLGRERCVELDVEPGHWAGEANRRGASRLAARCW
jgi:hypothetical protein